MQPTASPPPGWSSRPTGAPPPAGVSSAHKAWIASYVLLLLGIAAAMYLVRLGVIDVGERYLPLLRRSLTGAMALVLVLGTGRLVQATLVDRACDAVTRYNLRRIVRLMVVLVIAVIVVSVLFANWYAAAASLGLISLVLGFALQTPITSFIGWIYILTRKPYQVGDRISIGGDTGDVIDVTYLDTTLWEVGGTVSTNHPSGRIIKFPNANVLTSAVTNHSWERFPYIWDEISVPVAFDSDLPWVAQVMQQAASEELGDAMIERVRTWRDLLASTPVDQLEVQERPSVLFRADPNTWLDARVRYLVDPRTAGSVKTRLLTTLLARLNQHPERVRFPRGDNR
jgi:small-conductance mechanosensitive channel